MMTHNAPPVYIVGDIHGQYQQLSDLLRGVGLVDDRLDWVGGAALLWFIGDFFDRGPCGLESVDLVKVGKAPRIKQDESKATYEGRCGVDNAHIDWGKPWEQIDRLIRGCNPAPGAWSMLDGKALKIFDAKPMPAKDPKGIAGKMGEIVEVGTDGFTVVCADGRFKVTRVQPADGKKIDAGEFVSTAKLATGTRFS